MSDRDDRTTLWLGVAIAALIAAALALAGCGSGARPAGSKTGGASGEGLSVAPGLYDLSYGEVRAVGTLVHSDLEGGFWVIVKDAQSPAGSSNTVVVVANGADLEGTLRRLESQLVSAVGTRSGDVSIRQAGPEIVVTSIAPANQAPAGK